jgi:hypothetical protein
MIEPADPRFLAEITTAGRFLGASELSRRDADEALEVIGQLTLIGESGVLGNLCEGHVACGLHHLLGPLNATLDDVLVGWQAAAYRPPLNRIEPGVRTF